MKNLLLSFVVLFCFTTSNTIAQSTKGKTQLVSFKNNVDSDLTIKEMNILKEVYKNQLDKQILSSPSRLKNMKHLLRNRLEIIQINSKVNADKYINLSEVELFNNYNENLIKDSVYDKESFNPLKYNLPFFKIGDSMYKIFNSNYYLVIKSQTTKR